MHTICNYFPSHTSHLQGPRVIVIGAIIRGSNAFPSPILLIPHGSESKLKKGFGSCHLCQNKQLSSMWAYLLGLLAMIKCSICSYQCDNWYVSNWRLACHINFSLGRSSLELAQGPSRVALAWHTAGSSTPFGVTNLRREWWRSQGAQESLRSNGRGRGHKGAPDNLWSNCEYFSCLPHISEDFVPGRFQIWSSPEPPSLLTASLTGQRITGNKAS